LEESETGFPREVAPTMEVLRERWKTNSRDTTTYPSEMCESSFVGVSAEGAEK